MLKLYPYGYLNRVRSSRRLAAETTRNLELIWLLRGVRPDFRTIADFRRDNRAAFKAVFRAFVLLCRKLDLFGRELLAVDGTRLKAVNSRARNFSRERLATYLAAADARLERYLAELDQIDRGEDGAGTGRADTLATKIARLREQRQASAALLGQLEESGEGQISLTDPDARLMVVHSKVTVGYNAQVAVDARHSLIVEQQVTNACNDMGLLAPTTGAAMEALGVERIDAVADMGYHSGDDIVACEAVGITPYIPRPHRGTAVGNGLFPKERFRYDPDADADHCSGGQVLDTRYASVTRGLDQAVGEPGRVPDARAGEGSRRVQPDGTRLQSQTGHHAHRCAGADPGGAGLIRGPISAAKTPDIAWPDVHPDLTSTQWMKIPNLAHFIAKRSRR
ncbi:transposase [Sphingomonas sp. Leaf231]|uniref:transposase n=1 Tax=Sphingomonas sp. Leaf231 TaxID=1736301 RepID=UPI000A6B3A2D|nr:transposase [Sphingomonas sp. Leaf231]